MQSYISKKDTKVLYGVAILLMVFHHMFYLPERLNYSYTPMLVWNGIAHETILANFAKICVPIYSFISGYGMYLCCRPLNQNQPEKIFQADYRKVIKSLWGFYQKFWLVFIIFIPMGFLWFGYEFHLTDFVRSFLGELEIYNGEWWYVEQYVKMLILFPVLDFAVCILEKIIQRMEIIGIICGAALVVVLASFYIFPRLMGIRISFYIFLQRHYLYVVFVEGYLLARYDLFGFAAGVLDKRWFKIVCSVLGLLFVISGRIYKVKDAASTLPDIIFTPILIFCIVTLLHECGKLRYLWSFLEFMGGYSTYIWLTHTFFAYYYFQKWIMLPKYSLLIYFWLLLVSLVTAMILTVIYKGIKWLFMKGASRGSEYETN